MNSSTRRCSSSVTVARSSPLKSCASPATRRPSSSAVRMVWSSRASSTHWSSVRAAYPASRPASQSARCRCSATRFARARPGSRSRGKRARRSMSERGANSRRPYPPVATSESGMPSEPGNCATIATNSSVTTSSVSAEMARTTSCPPAPPRCRARIWSRPSASRVFARATAASFTMSRNITRPHCERASERAELRFWSGRPRRWISLW